MDSLGFFHVVAISYVSAYSFVTPDVNGGPTDVPPSAILLWAASDVAFDQSGNMWVSDENDERILKYDAVKDPNFYPNLFHCGQPASLVLGQTDFTHRNLDQMHASDSTLFAPQAIAFDVASDLWVADNQYNRVLRFSNPFSTGQSANLVLGQSSFTSIDRPSPPTASSLNQPAGIAFDHSGNLWVADSGNNRILRYSRPFSSPPLAQQATKVLGKQNFTS